MRLVILALLAASPALAGGTVLEPCVPIEEFVAEIMEVDPEIYRPDRDRLVMDQIEWCKERDVPFGFLIGKTDEELLTFLFGGPKVPIPGFPPVGYYHPPSPVPLPATIHLLLIAFAFLWAVRLTRLYWRDFTS